MSRDAVMWEDQWINPLKTTNFSSGEDFDSVQWVTRIVWIRYKAVTDSLVGFFYGNDAATAFYYEYWTRMASRFD